MTEIRVKAYHHFVDRPMPGFGDREALEGIKFDEVCYYLRSSMPLRKTGTMFQTTSGTHLIDLGYLKQSKNGCPASLPNMSLRQFITASGRT